MADINKTVIINRAVPGSGKTSISRCIAAAAEKENFSVAIHSTDDYFMQPDGTYKFEISLLSEYHKRNLRAFSESINRKTDLVFCDNTNLISDQSRHYTEIARAAGYFILLITFEPRSLEAHIAAQAVTPQKPDAHNVPELKLREMINNYREYSKLLNPSSVLNPFTDVEHTWNEEFYRLEKNGTPLKHYDYDKLITIYPEDYHTIKENIGAKVVRLMKMKKNNNNL